MTAKERRTSSASPPSGTAKALLLLPLGLFRKSAALIAPLGYSIFFYKI